MSDANEVAEDYRLALEDLSSNMRFEISNLTVIARENTEHALTIADVLQQHILKAAPSKKLPALYVLDSIVKNVGTPYTLYFGRNLFKIFMESYAVVDNPIRKKMEEMLRTWKDPVPGSMDMRPVFSHELVRPIENALMKVRAASMPQGPIPGRPRPGMFPQRDTPTPPGMRGQPGQYPPPGQQYANGQQPSQHSRPSPQPYGLGQAPYQQPGQGQYGTPVAPGPPGITVDNLPNDIQELITATKEEASQFPHDTSVQTKLRALMDLQTVVQRGGIPPDQLELIKNKVTELVSVPRRATSAQPPSFPPGNLPYQPHAGHSTSVTPTPTPAAQQAQAPTSLDSLLGQGALAALMARATSASQNSTPNPPAAAFRSPPPQPEPVAQAPPAQNDPMSLLNKLRAAGMLPGATPPAAASHTPTPPPPAPQASGQPMFPANLASILAMAKAQGGGGQAAYNPDSINVMSLKQQFRPDLINKLYDALGPPCTQCGRRFKTDEEGRKKKTAHMDWHFKVHQRSAEAEKRGMHRSWYVDQQDWLKSREVVDSDHVAAPEDTKNETSKEAEGPKYIPVPEPGSGINTVCPICQERFENKWLDTAQEWVWLDAVLVRNRAFHASCLAEASRDRDGTPRRTPDPVLGKRKADPSILSPNMRTIKPY